MSNAVGVVSRPPPLLFQVRVRMRLAVSHAASLQRSEPQLAP